ncbi:PucR family transcriptional regulator [Streptomyces sp. NPDC101110]|uniref:PucR family transcriptional regulator n=1 Tax=unclassified Streptomyces TaxID=2593676 RepID=UPI00381F65E8
MQPSRRLPCYRWLKPLTDALTGRTAADDRMLQELAQRATWPLPERLRAVAVVQKPAHAVPSAGPGWLADWSGEHPYVLIAHPGPDPATLLNRLVGDLPVVVGPDLPVHGASLSLRWARSLLPIAARESAGRRVVFQVEDHLPALLLLQDEALTQLLIKRRLAPLASLTRLQRERLTETLTVWLEAPSATEAARRLHVHPQTVRYRMRQAHRLFGPELNDPATRLELVLALHGLRLTEAPRWGVLGSPPASQRCS